MACNKPIKGWYSRNGGFTLKSSEAYLDMPMQVPCGQCMGCRIAKTADWATRIIQESQLWEENAFITLTYDDENLPKDLGLHVEHVQLFMKRLRKYLEPQKIRYYLCGEYGDNTWRPHYHAIIFNYWPEDIKHYKTTSYGKLYNSEKLEKLWQMGFVVIGEVTYETASYTASYVTKKLSGMDVANTDARFKYRNRTPEFALMSRRPGIGIEWYKEHKDITFHHNSVVVNGFERVPPQYYKRKFKEENPKRAQEIKLASIRKRNEQDRLDTIERFLVNKNKFFAKNTI
jgi:hypothetical protein